MHKIAAAHLERLETAVLRRHSAASIARWITENTKLGGRPYSFLNHEFQETIASDTSREKNVRKCAQVGVSELSARIALAFTNVITPFTVAYTLPTAHFAGTSTKTRIDPVIDSSEVLKSSIHKTTDNNEVKRFGDSYLYVRGAASSNSPISIPCDMLIHDEFDFCDLTVLKQYRSRITHSSWKQISRFSTPTLPNFGIDKEFQSSRRFFNLCKCDHCAHWFQPDYYEHVKIPGYNHDLRALNKQTRARSRWKEATLLCPKCGKQPSLAPEHRKYVQENLDDNYEAAGYQVSPFDAPKIISAADLVESSTEYERIQDFVNFALGLPMEDSEATLSRADFINLFLQTETPSNVSYVMGIDVGNVYHFVVAAIDGYGDMFVVRNERVPMGNARRRYSELQREFRPLCSVIDSGPHAETVMALQEADPNLYAAVYVKNKGVLTHHVVEKEKVKEEGQEFVRQVNVNRSRAFDGYMNYIRENHLTVRSSDENELVISHHTSMKRTKIFDSDSGEMSYAWQKTDGDDHYHHAFLYAWIASKIQGVSKPLVILPTTSMFKFRLKPQ